MLFNSFEFIFAFVPIVVIGYFGLARLSHVLAAVWLALASLFFYGWWDTRYLWLLGGSICLNYAAGIALARRSPTGSIRMLLAASVSANLLLLGVFKYAAFFAESLTALTGLAVPQWHMVLPLGISFYTFTQIAFLVDAARGQAREYRGLNYLLFVTWFPHLIAGPILHHRDLMPQFEDPRTFRPRAANFTRGLAFFTIGLAKKVLLADSLAEHVGPAFAAAGTGDPLTASAAWAAAFAYTFQLYFDFSGYCDMAMGVSALFGVTLPVNFNRPYSARNIAEFWRRWHMTLSTFLRDYLYVPLGGNRRGPVRRHVNLMATMLLGGLWHGANWTFVAWGAWHGVLLVGFHWWRALRPTLPDTTPRRAPAAIAAMSTFLLVVLGWVLFRSESLTAAGRMLSAMTGVDGAGSAPPTTLLTLLAVSAFIVFAVPDGGTLVSATTTAQPLPGFSPGWRLTDIAAGLLYGAVLMTCIARLSAVSTEFLYYQF